MPRRKRVHIAGMPLHIVQRGHNRQACFFDETDYFAYLHWLKEALTQSGCVLHAYVLMTNHVHLLLTPSDEDGVSRCIMALGRRYVQYVNKTYGRTGTLWDSRYKSSLVHDDGYLLICQRYIELNPVRARMVDDPEHYRWSSYRANALGHDDEMLTPHAIYRALGRTRATRTQAYRSMFDAHVEDKQLTNIRMALHQSQPLGDNRFLDQIAKMVGERREARPRGRPPKVVG